ncbi:MAG: hypothetical protein ACSNEK_06185 [Parachlamydiaceae bacterium]
MDVIYTTDEMASRELLANLSGKTVDTKDDLICKMVVQVSSYCPLIETID